MAYEVEALETGQRLALHASDWGNLLSLAHRHGWRPSEGLEHYLRGGRRIVPPPDARALAGALEGPLRDLPAERREELRFVGAPAGFADEAPLTGPDADYEGYFAWQRRWIVKEVIRLCQQGALEVRPM